MTSDKTANRGEKKTDISYIQKDDHRRVTYYHFKAKYIIGYITWSTLHSVWVHNSN
jgi:hypothetical protein